MKILPVVLIICASKNSLDWSYFNSLTDNDKVVVVVIKTVLSIIEMSFIIISLIVYFVGLLKLLAGVFVQCFYCLVSSSKIIIICFFSKSSG